MGSAFSEELACVSTKGRILVKDGSRITMLCIDKAFQNEYGLRCAEDVAGYVRNLLEATTTRTFVSLLKDVARQSWSLRVHDNQMELLKSRYVLRSMNPELRQHQDQDIHRQIVLPRY